jgi:hypothetical protein
MSGDLSGVITEVPSTADSFSADVVFLDLAIKCASVNAQDFGCMDDVVKGALECGLDD